MGVGIVSGIESERNIGARVKVTRRRYVTLVRFARLAVGTRHAKTITSGYKISAGLAHDEPRNLVFHVHIHMYIYTFILDRYSTCYIIHY